jgi:hypothetical protein
MALTQISTAGVKDDAVTSGKIPANAVGSSELADNAVDTAAIADNAVTAAKIADGNVTTAKIVDNNITTAKIADGNISTAKIADGAVTAGKLASGVQTTINNNADNRVITGSGTANTLEGESNLKFDGSRLGINDPNFANYNADCDDIIIQGSGNTGITINSGGTGNSFTGNIAFAEGNGTGGSADAFRGAISYKHNDDYMTFYTDYNERMRIDSSGRVLIGTTTEGESTLDDLTIATSGDTGITIRSGTSNNGAIGFSDGTSGADEYRGIIDYDHNGDYFRFYTNASERMRIDSSGNVGIGLSSPSHKLTIQNMVNSRIHFRPIGDIQSSVAGAGLGLDILNDAGSTVMDLAMRGATTYFRNASTETMRIDTSGHVLFNCTSLPSNTTQGAGFERKSSQTTLFLSAGATSSASNVAEFFNTNGQVGRIVVTGSATSYHTSSDYRLKENATAISDGITRLKTLKPYRFNFKADADTTVDGFFAHEVTAVPEAISGTKDEVDSDNNPVYQGIDQSKLVPLLTAALQEAITKIETLETKVAVLEAA